MTRAWPNGGVFSTISTIADRAGKALVDGAGTAAEKAAEYWTSKSARIGVTGLARSGKTVFLTSLIHNLTLAPKRQKELLPFFVPAQQQRIRDVRIVGDETQDAFPYKRLLQDLLGEPPKWPSRTLSESRFCLDIEYAVQRSLASRFTDAATVRLELGDYPGEWLLDLPLLGSSFAEWSNATLVLCADEPRRRLSRSWWQRREWLESQANGPMNEADAARAAREYAAFLRAARRPPHSLTFLQPGRFLTADDRLSDPALHFCPLDPAKRPKKAWKGSVYPVMEERFDAYKKRLTEQFFRRHFGKYRRQIVLVDVLSALDGGPAVYADAAHALSAIMDALDSRRTGPLSRFLGLSPLERVLVVATKADHVPHSEYENLRAQLRLMAARENDALLSDGTEVSFDYLAAIKATENATKRMDGALLNVVTGVPLGEKKRQAIFTGHIPAHRPAPEDWHNGAIKIRHFEPPGLASAAAEGMPGIRLDKALQFLVGDMFAP
jgi:predicted YcjX-like family ATPase